MEKKQTLKQWLDGLEAEGKEVKIRWEGGNDDGCYFVEIDGVDMNTDGNNMGGILIDCLAGHIGYGSFAGDFSTTGELTYEDGHFSGTDYYSESESDDITKTIEVSVPDYLWFDSLSVNTDGRWDEDLSTTVEFSISNGPVVDEHITVQDNLEKVLSKAIEDALENIEGREVDYIYNDWSFNFDDGIVKDGMRTFFIEDINYSYEKGEDKEICIEITDEMEQEAEEIRALEKARWEAWAKGREQNNS